MSWRTASSSNMLVGTVVICVNGTLGLLLFAACGNCSCVAGNLRVARSETRDLIELPCNLFSRGLRTTGVLTGISISGRLLSGVSFGSKSFSCVSALGREALLSGDRGRGTGFRPLL
jgi:hypothetical protein